MTLLGGLLCLGLGGVVTGNRCHSAPGQCEVQEGSARNFYHCWCLVLSAQGLKMIPYDTGKPVRSWVLIPGTGSNMEAKPLGLDLGPISSVAGAVPVLQAIPQATPVGNLNPKENGVAKMKKEEVVKGRGSLSHGITSEASTVPQLSTPHKGTTGGGIKRSLSDESRVATKLMKREEPPPLTPGAEELQKKCTQLEERNKNLERRLAMFHDLFRSKERIISFVKFLETTA